ncbi:C45 family autoproteolytic acyltransferase/hydolase [Sciscionella sediminilitoris]|uniref:C45 family autoproteolytic acyltransferase/hydolase n=1 Tax=Sciscionella sediminilitoris TaxID=1445613 RepID=UPI0006894216|nr:C45 family peptidase [Sciscionella sp. SE31]
MTVTEETLAGLRRLRVDGERRAAFRAIGAAAAEEIHAVLAGLGEGEQLRRFAGSEAGAAAVDRVLTATRRWHGTELDEAYALAEGAGVDPHLLLLANLRRDLGGHDGLGCSDLALTGPHALLAHNEDGGPALEDRLVLLSLALDGEVPVTVLWYPGFVPSNTFVANGNGLVWGINHIQVATPADAPGRHFVARGLQRTGGIDEAVGYLAAHPSAGGFTYNIGELGTGRTVSVETAAGAHTAVEADGLAWHTNHLRYLDEPPAVSGATGAELLGGRDNSLARARVLEALRIPAQGTESAWALEILGVRPVPDGVYRSALDGDPLLTLCTFVAELRTGEITVRPRGRQAVTVPFETFVPGAGRARSSRGRYRTR